MGKVSGGGMHTVRVGVGVRAHTQRHPRPRAHRPAGPHTHRMSTKCVVLGRNPHGSCYLSLAFVDRVLTLAPITHPWQAPAPIPLRGHAPLGCGQQDGQGRVGQGQIMQAKARLVARGRSSQAEHTAPFSASIWLTFSRKAFVGLCPCASNAGGCARLKGASACGHAEHQRRDHDPCSP